MYSCMYDYYFLDPKDPPLNSNIALLMTQNGKFEKALQHANMVCKVQPGWAKVSGFSGARKL